MEGMLTIQVNRKKEKKKKEDVTRTHTHTNPSLILMALRIRGFDLVSLEQDVGQQPLTTAQEASWRGEPRFIT